MTDKQTNARAALGGAGPDLSHLSELERQDYYLKKLPQDFEFPLFSGRQAVESQRSSNYKNTACAARELVDNAIEAGAQQVRVYLDQFGRGAPKGQRRHSDAGGSLDQEMRLRHQVHRGDPVRR